MTRCSAVLEGRVDKDGKAIRCNLNANKEHEWHANKPWRWENKEEFIPRRKKQRKLKNEDYDDTSMIGLARRRARQSMKRK